VFEEKKDTGEAMQNKIKAMIDLSQVEVLTDSLKALGVRGETVSPVKVFGAEIGQTLIFRMKKQTADIRAETVIELIVDERQTGAVVAAIQGAQKSGTAAELCKIEVQPVEESFLI
jgi:nitrogen regulatory protein P-II 1